MPTHPTRAAPPTRETYTELQAAYDLFNTELFAGALPHCLITLQRKDKRTHGYFSPARFAKGDGATTDEIAMNPMWFKSTDLKEALQTLAHEMCHQWQQHCGSPSRAGYHNHEWAAKMLAIGLHPSSTGHPGGKIVGQHMADYVIEGGGLDRAIKRLFESGFALTWHDRHVPDLIIRPKPATEGGEEHAPAPALSGKRAKYICPECTAKAWGKIGLLLICGRCRCDMPAGEAARARDDKA